MLFCSLKLAQNVRLSGIWWSEGKIKTRFPLSVRIFGAQSVEEPSDWCQPTIFQEQLTFFSGAFPSIFFSIHHFSVPLLSYMFYFLTFFSGALQESILTRPAIVELRSLSFLFVFVWLVLFAWFKRNTSFFHQTCWPLDIEAVETKLKIKMMQLL